MITLINWCLPFNADGLWLNWPNSGLIVVAHQLFIKSLSKIDDLTPLNLNHHVNQIVDKLKVGHHHFVAKLGIAVKL
jgi:hypothetical protein